MNAFDVLADPVRRRILELLGEGEQTAGMLASVLATEFGVSQPGVSQHLRVLRESGFASVRPDGPRRLYSLAPSALDEVDAWLARVRGPWLPAFDALATEIARGKKQRRGAPGGDAAKEDRSSA